MKRAVPIILDPRRAAEIARQIRARSPGYLPDWVPPAKGPGAALIGVSARYIETLIERLNQVPHKNLLAFLDLLGVELIPAREARAPVAFQLGEDAVEVHLPAGAQVAAPPPPEESEQVVFETERGVGLSRAKLSSVVSLWPGRDQYIDHTQDLNSGELLRPFARKDLVYTPHLIYIAHETLLALAGEVQLDVEFELMIAGSEHLDVVWEYWDGQVWRGFKQQQAECPELGESKLDGTSGFTRSGRVRLESECAESAQREVGGIESFWIRGRLDEPLPPDPDQVLPRAAQIRLTNVLRRELDVFLLRAEPPQYEPSSTGQIQVRIADVNERGLPGVQLTLSGGHTEFHHGVTNTAGEMVLSLAPPTAGQVERRKFDVEVHYKDRSFSRELTYDPPPGQLTQRLELVIQVAGLQPELAFSDGESLDLSVPVFPLGQLPRPGTTLYLACEEAFSKPGARVTLHLEKSSTPQDEFDLTNVTKTDLAPVVGWEYWSGRRWDPLPVRGSAEVAKFLSDGTLEFDVPDDIQLTAVNEEQALWIRARLVSGAYGFQSRVTWNDGSNEFFYVVHRPPALADVRLSYVWEYGPFHPEHVLTHNDYSTEDRSQDAIWPGDSFPIFERVSDPTPALYLGFDETLPNDRTNIYVDVVEESGAVGGPAMEWEYFDGAGWRRLSVEDETAGFTHQGMVSFIGPDDSERLERFGSELHWVRARLAEDGPPPEHLLRGLHPHAVWVAQRQTVSDEDLGAGTGLPDQVLAVRRPPILGGERLEVRELSGQRARVEWRILAQELLGQDEQLLADLEDRLAEEGSPSDVLEGDLRLRRAADKSVSEAWVRWTPVANLLRSEPASRHYVIDRSSGRIFFGEGDRGKVPPIEARIVAREYLSGGGRRGNVAAGAITEILAGVAGAEGLVHPTAAEGGANGEALGALARRGPRTLRHRGRALAREDYETMALEASPAIAVARARATLDPEGRPRPGWVTLVVLPRSDEPRPQPSFGLRESVRRYVEERAPAELGAASRIFVTGPRYAEVDVDAVVAPLDAGRAGEVDQALRAALEAFLHPLTGGPEGNGWREGRDVYLSDIAAVMERVDGVDYVRELTLQMGGRSQGESASIPAGATAVAGSIRIQLVS